MDKEKGNISQEFLDKLFQELKTECGEELKGFILVNVFEDHSSASVQNVTLLQMINAGVALNKIIRKELEADEKEIENEC